jgi:hypothetical protein
MASASKAMYASWVISILVYLTLGICSPGLFYLSFAFMSIKDYCEIPQSFCLVLLDGAKYH